MTPRYPMLERQVSTQAEEIAQLRVENKRLHDLLDKASISPGPVPEVQTPPHLEGLSLPVETTMQEKVVELMHLYGQQVATIPALPADQQVRTLRANLVLEEALEFVAAMGLEIGLSQHVIGDIQAVHGFPTTATIAAEEIELRPGYKEPDLIEAADAIGDMLVVVLGAANVLGIDAEAVFNEVHRSNLSKIWPDGTIHKRESDGKVLKPESYSPADIADVLRKQGWSG